MRRVSSLVAAAALLSACGGSQSASSTRTGEASAPPITAPPVTTAPTAAAVLTNPPPTQIPGCLPKCWFGQLTRPGPLSGPYTTKYFFGGQLSLIVPDGWFGYEDSTGELAIGRPNDEGSRLELWLDVYASSDPAGTPDAQVERTGDAVLAWFLAKPIIHVVKEDETTLDGVPAQRIEYRINGKAATEDPTCPDFVQPCTIAFGYPEWDGTFSEGSGFHSQLVVANAMWGGERHSIYVEFASIESDYASLIDTVNAVIASVDLPDGVGPAQ